MSEFSESLHYLGESDQVRSIIKRARASAFILPSQCKWTSFVVAQKYVGMDEEIQQVIDCNDGLLLHYSCAEDHGFTFDLYEKEYFVSGYSCAWEKFRIKDKELNLETTASLLGVEPTVLDKLLHPEPEESGRKMAFGFVKLRDLIQGPDRVVAQICSATK